MQTKTLKQMATNPATYPLNTVLSKPLKWANSAKFNQGKESTNDASGVTFIN